MFYKRRDYGFIRGRIWPWFAGALLVYLTALGVLLVGAIATIKFVWTHV